MDTIIALSTPPGRSGIAVVRLSGNQTLQITRQLIRDQEFVPEPRRAFLKKIYDLENSEAIDTALITYFKGPNSFTGEDIVEISGHGSPVLIRQIIDACLQLDARLAQAGEFSLRALSNGQLNLSQAEAIRDLIDAQTTAGARQAARQLNGELSNQLQPLKDKLLNIIVVLESALEFVEDDLPDVATENIKQNLREVLAELERLTDTFRSGRLLREGLKVALVGRPNVGKSSLFNALLGQERAIVTEIAGTTRDQLHESLGIEGIPVALIDTAGVRETIDVVEKIGVERTHQAIADADLVIVILDAAQKLTDEDREVLAATAAAPRIIALNKTDLNANFDFSLLQTNAKIVRISAKTGVGLTELQKQIVAPFAPHDVETSSFLISDARHHDLLVRAQEEIVNALPLIEMRVSEEIILVGLHNALRYLGQVTGETTSEDVLTRIFETFCIGK